METGLPQVAFREAVSTHAEFDYIHKKQTGGSGQFGRVAGYVEPSESGEYEFVSEVKGGAIPTEYIPSCKKGFEEALKKGNLIGFPIVGVRVVLTDGQYHAVDSSDMAFHTAAISAFRKVYRQTDPKILEPIMKVHVETPNEFQGSIFASINQRRGTIISSYEDNLDSKIEAEVPLKEMFGYATVLRSLTQGKAEFSMEFEKYARVPKPISEELIEEYEKKK